MSNIRCWTFRPRFYKRSAFVKYVGLRIGEYGIISPMFTELQVPIETLATIAFGFGAIIGSFLNVYIYRFHTGRSLAGRSHCLSCGTPLRAYELLPILSYLWLRGRCRTCGCAFTARYFFVELVTGLLFVLAVYHTQILNELFLLVLLLSILVVIFIYDIRHFIIPDSLTIASTVMAVGLMIVYYGTQWNYYLIDLAAAALGSSFLFLLWFVSKGQWLGFGDVKLAIPLGLMVGASKVFSMIVFSFWIGAAVSLLLVGLAKLERGKLTLPFLPAGLTIKSVVPFAPFLIAGSLLVFFTNLNVLTIF